MKIFANDAETYPNFFLWGGQFLDSDDWYIFEISPRRNDMSPMLDFLYKCKEYGVHLLGYNNIGFDNEIMEFILKNPYEFTPLRGSQLAGQIIGTQETGERWNTIWYYNRFNQLIDLMKLNGFDRKGKYTSLKHLEFNMRMDSVQDLPFEIRDLTFQEMDMVIDYWRNDIAATKKFGKICKPQIEMRRELSEIGVVDGDVMNMADQNIGEKLIEKRLGKHKTHFKGEPLQTHRKSIDFRAVVLPSTKYRFTEYTEVADWYRSLVIVPKQKDVHYVKTLQGIEYHFGLGGIHGSVGFKQFHEDDKYVIKDDDVGGMYPAIANANEFYPEHLGRDFIPIYRDIPVQRKKHGKKSSMGKAYKLAANAVFGKSGDFFSFLFDLLFFYRITINGQLQLWRLIEMFNTIPGLQIIQANTDGVTSHVPREYLFMYEGYKASWQKEVGLELETADYKSMFVRDVNNYLAVRKDGTTKGKGAYGYPKSLEDMEGFWNKDYSMQVVPKVTEYCLINNLKPEDVIRAFTDPFDYLILHKGSASNKLYINGELQQKTLRCYISYKGHELIKHMEAKGTLGAYKRKSGLKDEFYYKILRETPEGCHNPLIHTKNKSVVEDREQRLEKGYLVKQANHIKSFDWSDLNYDYYINEVNKLIGGFR